MPNLPNSETFTASRWTKGNLFFPVRIIVTPQHVSRVKSRLFGSSEESIALGKVASVQISTGSDLVRDSHRFLRWHCARSPATAIARPTRCAFAS